VTAARDLSGELGPVRDQGPRGTCLAFAATTVHEQARRVRRGAWTEPLGEEILYWACKQRDGDSRAGTHPESARDALRATGQSAARLWPYDPARDDSTPDFSPPPQAEEPDTLRHASLQRMAHGLDALRRRVDDRHAVIVGLELWPGFFAAPDGALGSPSLLELIGEAHAVVLAGYDDNAAELLLRNSWSQTWGRDGYGRLSYGALPTVVRGAWTVDDDLDS
jgi:Papain family cysteine protease